MYKAGVVFSSAHEGWIYCIAHEGCHGIAYFKIACCDWFAALIKGNCDIVQALFQVCEVIGYGKNCHALRPYCDTEFRLHHEAVLPAAHADDYMAEGLGAEVHYPPHLHTGGVYVKPPHSCEPLQLLVIVVTLMLHAGCHRHHGQVVISS